MPPVTDDPEFDVRAGARDLQRTEDERFMRLAIEQAWIGLETPGAGEVGCIIVHNGEVVAVGHNESELRHDPSAHAEIVTMRKLGQKWKTTEFRDCTPLCPETRRR
jgi:tRNA(Arg) A34 adenosine deaminase TadA